MPLWKDELKANVVSLEDLKNTGWPTGHHKMALEKIIALHPMSITRYYLSLVNPENPRDPIKKMIMPSINELDQDGSYDTSGEISNTVSPNVQHKYDNTVLVHTTNQCAAYCRYCFRKRRVGYPDDQLEKVLHQARTYIQQHRQVNNVLVSGGDPLTLPNHDIQTILDYLLPIAHLDYIRFGSKIPVVFPQRITSDRGLIKLLSNYSQQGKQLYVITHFNHPREITAASMAAVSRLRQAGIIVNNQSVLMKGVNDRPSILAALMKSLVRHGINPYYLFQCRPVSRVKKNFQLPLRQGLHIVEKAKQQLDGHAKRFKYVMSHVTGKIEILGELNEQLLFKYHQAKDMRATGKLFAVPTADNPGWLDREIPLKL